MRIDPEFKALIPPLSHEERAQLEANIIAEGCRDAVVIWAEQELLLDGHNRHTICIEHQLPFDRTFISLPSRAAAINWIIRNQLGRRNLTLEQRGYLIGTQYDTEKGEWGGEREPSGNYCHLPKRKQVADEHNIGERTVENYAKFKRAIDTIAEVTSPEVAQGILTREIPMTMKDAIQIAAVARDEPEVAQAAIDEVVAGNAKSFNQAVASARGDNGLASHQLINSSASNEWYTPSPYIEAARRVMGSIDLDPASCEVANETIQAGEFFAIEDDGLAQQWYGNVWLNPPYGYGEGNQSNQSLWVERVLAAFISGEINQAVLLVNAVPGNKWFAPLFDYLICFTDHRIKFTPPNGNAPQPTHSNALVYFGNNGRGFVRRFSQFGTVVARVSINE